MNTTAWEVRGVLYFVVCTTQNYHFFDVAPYPSLASRQTLDLVVRVQKTVSIYPCKAHTAHLSVLLMGDLTGSIHLLLPPLVCV